MHGKNEMANQFIGLDVGTWSVKAVVIDPKTKGQIVLFDEERIIRLAPAPAPPEPVAEDPPAADDAPTDAIAAQGGEPGGDWEASKDEGAPAGEGEDAPESQASEAPPEDETEAWSEALSRLLSRLDVDQDAIATALPFGDAMTITLEDLPFGDPRQLARIMPNLLIDRLPMNLSEVVTDFYVTSDGESHEATVGFAKLGPMGEFIEGMKGAGTNPALVGVPELLLGEISKTIGDEDDESTWAVLDMGHSSTRVLLVRAGEVVAARSVRRGGEAVTRSLAETFRIDWEAAERLKHQQGAILQVSEEQDPGRAALGRAVTGALSPLVRELRRTFRSLYARRQLRVDRIYMVGGASLISGLDAHLTQELGVPVAHLDLNSEAAEPQNAGALARAALGLSAARSLAGDRASERTVNLRQGPFVYRGKSSYLRSQLRFFAAAAAVLMLLGAGALMAQRADLMAQRDAMRAAVTAESKKLFGKPLYKEKDIVARLTTTDTSSESSIAPKRSAFDLMHELITSIKDDKPFRTRRVEVDAERKLMQIYGYTSTAQEVVKIVSEIEEMECIKEGDVKQDKLQTTKDEVSFELQINASGCS